MGPCRGYTIMLNTALFLTILTLWISSTKASTNLRQHFVNEGKSPDLISLYKNKHSSRPNYRASREFQYPINKMKSKRSYDEIPKDCDCERIKWIGSIDKLERLVCGTCGNMYGWEIERCCLCSEEYYDGCKTAALGTGYK